MSAALYLIVGLAIAASPLVGLCRKYGLWNPNEALERFMFDATLEQIFALRGAVLLMAAPMIRRDGGEVLAAEGA